MKAFLVSMTLVLASVSVTPVAHAQASQSKAMEAERLFREALAAEDAHDFGTACQRFQESQDLDPATGTLMNLARCHERSGQLAKAFIEYSQVAVDAQRDGQGQRSHIASERAKELESKISKLHFDASTAPRLQAVEVDKRLWHREDLVNTIPVEAGQHEVRFKYDDGRERDTAVVAKPGVVSEVVIPTPIDKPGAASTVPPVPPKHGEDAGSNGSTLRTAGWALGGVGVAGIATGAVFGLVALNKKSQLDDVCPQANACKTSEGPSMADSTRSAATVSTVAFIAGGVLVASSAAILLWPRDEKADRPARDARLRVTTSGTGVVLGGAF